MISKKQIQLLPFCLLMGVFNDAAKAQEPLNTQIQFSSISRNPALAGIQPSDLTINITYQPQNPAYLIPYKALQLQIESQFRNRESLEGLTAAAIIRYEEVGINLLKRAQFLPVLNFHKSLSDVKISFLNLACMVGIFKSQFDQSNLPTTKNFNPIPFDPANPVPQFVAHQSSSYVDFTTGISFYEEVNDLISVYLGAALFHFSQTTLIPSQAISKMPREWVLNSGLNFSSDNFSLQLLNDFRINQTETTIYSGFICGFPISKNLWNQKTEINLGTYYNSKKELSPVISLKSHSITTSFSYTIYTGNSKAIPILPNALECNISIPINCHQRTIESEKMKCRY